MELSAEQVYESCRTVLNTDSVRMLSEHAEQQIQPIIVAHLEKECIHAQQYDPQKV